MSDSASPTVDTSLRGQPPLPANQAGREQETPCSAGPPSSPAVAVSVVPTPGSLEERVAKRREQLEKKTTELFDVPGYEGVFQVELRLLGGKRRYAISEAHERVHDEYQKGLRSAADSILSATIAIHAVVDEEGTTAPAEGMTWVRLAQAADKNLGPETKPRVALVRLLGENGVISLAEDWITWMKSRGSKVDQALEQDF